MNASNTLKKLGIEQTFNYIYKDPDKHMPKMMDWADKFADGEFISQRKIIRDAITDPEHPYYHYIRRLFKKTLLEALQSPMMMAYHDNQPFNENMLRPCPMLENPDKLRAMVEKSGAHSTDLQSPETAEHLCAKCDQYAKNWKPVADELWKENREKKGIAN